jgi:hypothetical protein
MSDTSAPLKPIADMSTAEMVAEYNRLTGKTIKKFSTRAAGEKQLAAARSIKAKDMSSAIPTKAASTHLAIGKTIEGNGIVPGMMTVNHPINSKSIKNARRSAAISETWNDPVIAAKRAQRNAVQVFLPTPAGDKGQTFRSTGAAFKSLGLPLNQCNSFRLTLKAKGTAHFMNPKDDTVFKFVIINK